MFGEPWGYGDYGQFHMVVWIILPPVTGIRRPCYYTPLCGANGLR